MDGGSPFFPEEELSPKDASFLTRHRTKVIVGVLLLVLIAAIVAIAVPLASRGGGDKGDGGAAATAGAKEGSAGIDAEKEPVGVKEKEKETKKKKEKTDSEEVKEEKEEKKDEEDEQVEEKEETVQGRGASVEKRSTGGDSCVYIPSGPTISMDARVPRWGPGDENVWRTESDGVTFLPGQFDPHRVWPPGDFEPRSYKFQVAEAGQYFVSAKTTASASTEFNDMWLGFPHGGGLEFRHVETHQKAGVTTGDGYAKAYQNDGADKVGIFTVDHDPHHFNTVMVLEPGTDYFLKVAGRASRFTVKRLLLTKCVGDECGGSAAIQARLDEAANGPPTECFD